MALPDLSSRRSSFHLTPGQLQNYLADRLLPADHEAAERHLQVCSLCTEALEGLEDLPTAALNDSLADLSGRLQRRVAPKRRPLFGLLTLQLVTAAVLLLIAGLTFFLLRHGVLPNSPKPRSAPPDTLMTTPPDTLLPVLPPNAPPVPRKNESDEK